MRKTKEKHSSNILRIILSVILSISSLIFFSARWFTSIYGDVGFDSIIFTLKSNMTGVQAGLIGNYLLRALFPTIILSILLILGIHINYKKKIIISIKNKKLTKFRLYPFTKPVSSVISILMSLVLIFTGIKVVKLDSYIKHTLQKTTIYENSYVNPESVNITFPEKKRNLIYIFLESMETSYMSKEVGGADKNNLIPELYTLASENTNFSQNDGVGGWQAYTGTTWTVGSMVAQTSGIPLSIPIEQNSYGQYDKFLPGAVTIMDILHENGYNQALMMGSDSAFGGRDKYYSQHGIDNIYDIYTARKDGIVPEDYWVWWGMEDLHLFKYAKQKLTEMASDSKPFAFSMLTVDTHFVDGYKCELCKDDYEEQYDNVIACSSRQVSAFVDWITKQDFYDNTTIIICGDHNTMDKQYVERNFDSDYLRHVYNCYINSAVTSDNTKHREITPFDMFPTTLAAMGCKIEGNRLGLGTNLFSSKKAIAELYGPDKLNSELKKNSPYYKQHFLFGKK